jgi:hypothetical protein
MQIFADFENVMTHFRTQGGGRYLSYAPTATLIGRWLKLGRSVSTAELIESSGILPPEVWHL